MVQGILRAYADITIDNSVFLSLGSSAIPAVIYFVGPMGRQTEVFRQLVSPAANDERLKLIQDAVVAEYKKVTRPTVRGRRRVWLPT